MPTLAEFEKAALHEARAIVAGKDECLCKVCRKVEAAEALAAEQKKSRSSV